MKKLRSSPISLILIVLIAAMAMSAKATPVRARATLLSLYAKSDAIMIARYDKREDSGTNRVGDGFTAVTTKTYFDVSTVIKGEPRKFVVIEDEEFRYQIQKGNDAPADAAFVIGVDAGDLGGVPKPGDTVLLFLKNDGDEVTLADEHDGVRKVTPTDQTIFVERIKELNSIFDNGEADSAKIAAWLVRCAEQPATRWDGTHELMQGFRHLEWREKKDANGYERIDPSVSYVHGTDAANALSSELKNALTQILVNSNFSSTSNAASLSEGDRELIALVKRWDPKTAANYLLGQLKSRAFSAHENAGMMYKISELLGDSRSADITRVYRETTANDNDSPMISGKSAAVKADLLARTLDRFIRNAETALSDLSRIQSN
jgi:hypothetical protein